MSDEKKHGLLTFGIKLPETVIIKTREGDEIKLIVCEKKIKNSKQIKLVWEAHKEIKIFRESVRRPELDV